MQHARECVLAGVIEVRRVLLYSFLPLTSPVHRDVIYVRMYSSQRKFLEGTIIIHFMKVSCIGFFILIARLCYGIILLL